MALPQRTNTETSAPGQTRRVKTTLNEDFAYLGEAENDPAYAPTDERFARTAYSGNVLRPVGIGQSSPAKGERPDTPGSDSAPVEARQPNQTASSMREVLKRRLASKAAATLATTSGRVRASAINTEAFSWQVPLWLFVQLPFAVLGTLTLGVVGVMDSVTTNPEGGFLSWVLDKVTAAASALAKFVGIDFLEIAFNLYLLCSVLIFGIGLFSVSFLFLQYKISFLEPLSGRGAGLKHGLLLLTFIGYAVPIANLFPFIFLWMAAVWYYPR